MLDTMKKRVLIVLAAALMLASVLMAGCTSTCSKWYHFEHKREPNDKRHDAIYSNSDTGINRGSNSNGTAEGAHVYRRRQRGFLSVKLGYYARHRNNFRLSSGDCGIITNSISLRSSGQLLHR